MLNFFSLILIIAIILFVLFFKRKSISKFTKKKNLSYKEEGFENPKDISNRSKIKNIYFKPNRKNYTVFEKKELRIEMIKLFKGNKKEKLKALEIAEDLGDKSTLFILRIGLKDMDSDIVKLSAILIKNFK